MTLNLDPSLFSDTAISDETRAFNAKLEAMLADLPASHEVPPEVTRAARDEGKGIIPSGGPLDGSVWESLPGAPGSGRVRVTEVESPDAVYLHIHGGGWTLGRPSYEDARNQRLAKEANVTVVSVEYRLAPEHTWPAQREDVLAVAQWLMAEGPARFGTRKIIIGGESAGAHLAATTALALKWMQKLDDVVGLVLNYGVFDLTLTPSMANWGERKLILSTPTVEWFVDNLDPGGTQRESALLSPLKADLSGLPPALFLVGTCDPLLDDTLMMATRYTSAGNAAEVAVYPGGVHAFDAFDELEIAQQSRARVSAFVSGLL